MQTPYQRWYSKNKESFNRKRRERYAVDQEYRDKMIALVKASRRNTESKRQEGVLTLGKLAEYVDKSSQTLREWESIGLIPRSVDSNGYRVYRQDQADLIKVLSDAMTEARYNRAVQWKVEQAKAELWEKWNAH